MANEVTKAMTKEDLINEVKKQFKQLRNPNIRLSSESENNVNVRIDLLVELAIKYYGMDRGYFARKEF